MLWHVLIFLGLVGVATGAESYASGTAAALEVFLTSRSCEGNSVATVDLSVGTCGAKGFTGFITDSDFIGVIRHPGLMPDESPRYSRFYCIGATKQDCQQNLDARLASVADRDDWVAPAATGRCQHIGNPVCQPYGPDWSLTLTGEINEEPVEESSSNVVPIVVGVVVSLVLLIVLWLANVFGKSSCSSPWEPTFPSPLPRFKQTWQGGTYSFIQFKNKPTPPVQAV